MTNIMKACELDHAWNKQSFEGWMTTAMGAAPLNDAVSKENVAGSPAIEFDDFLDLLEPQQSAQFDNVPAHEWDVFLAGSDPMLSSMQGCLAFIWG